MVARPPSAWVYRTAAGRHRWRGRCAQEPRESVAHRLLGQRILRRGCTVMTFGIAWAQTSATPPTTGLAPGAGATSSGGSAAMGFLVILALLVIVGVAVRLYDRKRKRDAEAVHLQAQVSDALMRDARLAGLVLTPTARVPTGAAARPSSRSAARPSTSRRMTRSCVSRARRPRGSVRT